MVGLRIALVPCDDRLKEPPSSLKKIVDLPLYAEDTALGNLSTGYAWASFPQTPASCPATLGFSAFSACGSDARKGRGPGITSYKV